MSSKIKILKMRESDISDVLKIYEECNLSRWTYADYLKEIRLVNSINYTAKIAEQIIGFITARLIMSQNNIPTLYQETKEKFKVIEVECEIYNIGVRKFSQRNGVGNSLLFEILKKCKQSNAKKIWLEVRQSNQKAVNFYKKNNFKEKYRRPNFYNNPPDHALVMSLDKF